MTQAIILSKNNTYSGVLPYEEFLKLFINKEYKIKCVKSALNNNFGVYKIYGMNSTKLKQMIEEYIC